MRLSNKLIRRKKLNLQDNLGTPAIATRADVDAIPTDYFLYTISSYLFYNPQKLNVPWCTRLIHSQPSQWSKMCMRRLWCKICMMHVDFVILRPSAMFGLCDSLAQRVSGLCDSLGPARVDFVILPPHAIWEFVIIFVILSFVICYSRNQKTRRFDVSSIPSRSIWRSLEERNYDDFSSEFCQEPPESSRRWQCRPLRG